MKILVWDTETTGLTLHQKADLSLQPRIIEFAGAIVCSEAGGIISEHTTLINPLISLSDEIIKITGIEDKMLFDAPTFPDALRGIAAAFAAADAHLAHNLEFDETMLRNELARLPVAVEFPWPAVGICTVQLYAEEWGRNPRLVDLYEQKLGRKLAQTHRALDDVRALAEIVIQEQLWHLFRS